MDSSRLGRQTRRLEKKKKMRQAFPAARGARTVE
jgi:hypothetical protein